MYVFGSIQNYIKPTPERLQMLSHCMLNNFKLMTDDATINNRAGHKHYYVKMAMVRGCPFVVSRSVRDLHPGSGSSTTLPLADQLVKTWICQFIPHHVWTYAESFVLRPTSCFD